MNIEYKEGMQIMRWTSPTLIIKLEDGLNADDIAAFSLVVKQTGKTIFDKPTFTKIDEGTVAVKIPATDTQRLKASERPQTQVRYKMKDNDQFATDIFEFVVKDVLKDGLI